MALKPAHHPPEHGGFIPPTSTRIDYIKGTKAIAGFGNKDFYIAAIHYALAREIIIANHYSKRIVNNSYIHLGVFINGALCGVLQFGYCMNNVYGAQKIVTGTQQDEYLELNRMWLDDVAPHNSESKGISYTIKYIKRVCPKIAWIQSFADERCKCLGVVYQAANFLYFGHHKTMFYMLDGEVYHKILLEAHTKRGIRGKHLAANIDRATKHHFNQFRYIYFIKRSWIARCKVKPLPYPKPNQPLPTRRIKKVNRLKKPP